MLSDRMFWLGFGACLLVTGLLYVLTVIFSIEKKSKRHASLAAFLFVCGAVCAFAGLVTSVPWLKTVCILASSWDFVWGLLYMRLYCKEKRDCEMQKVKQGAEHFDRYA